MKPSAVALALCIASVSVLAQELRSEWITWTRAHHHPITSIAADPDDTFEDLEFFRKVIGDRRIVQLGESAHGVAEFSQAKIRLIKFLHEHIGFDVLAEAGLLPYFSMVPRHQYDGVLFVDEVNPPQYVPLS